LERGMVLSELGMRAGSAAFVLGNGLAANLLACTLLRNNVDVTLLARDGTPNHSRNVHVHSVSKKTLDSFSALAGCALDGIEFGDGLKICSDGRFERLAPRPVVDLSRLLSHLEKQADRLGVARTNLLATGSKLNTCDQFWTLENENGEEPLRADLLVDASGGSRGVCELLEHLSAGPIFVDDGGSASFYQTFVGIGTPELGPLTLVFQQVSSTNGAGVDGLIAFHSCGQTAMTLKSDIPLKQTIEHAPRPLDGLNASQWPPALKQRLAAISWARGSTRYTSFGARRLALEEANLEHLPPCFAIGDALVQTPPSQGQGLAQLVAQLAIVEAALARGEDFKTIRNRLGTHAHAAWLAAALRATAPDPEPIQPNRISLATVEVTSSI
jgi:GNAT superfamily N-acetyltransferase